MDVEQEIFAWTKGRASWYEPVLAYLVGGGRIDDAIAEAVEAHLLLGTPLTARPSPTDATAPGDGTRAAAADGTQGAAVSLRSITEVTGVSALAAQQTLTFGPSGVTVVFGENGSGKSSYARLLKAAVKSRHSDDILSNIFSSDPVVQRASVTYEVNGESYTYHWPGTVPTPLQRVAFYDESCRRQYVASDLELSFRPAALLLLDGLVDVADRVRRIIDEKLAVNRSQTRPLPRLAAGSAPSELLQRLESARSQAALDAAAAEVRRLVDSVDELPEEIELRRTLLATRRAADPGQVRRRHLERARRLSAVAAHLRMLDETFSPAAASHLFELATRSLQAQQAADVASSATFAGEPVAGVGETSWRLLWDAARRFSVESAYPGRDFPVLDPDASCVLCHQGLDEPAKRRLSSFEAFVRDDTNHQAEVAARAVTVAQNKALGISIRPAAVAADLALLGEDNLAHGQAIDAVLARYTERREALVTWDRTTPLTWSGSEVDDLAAQLELRAQEEHATGLSVDAETFGQETARAQSELDALLARQHLVEAQEDIAAEIERRSERLRLDEARSQTDTRALTRKSSELSELLVTELVVDRFTRELALLRLERVTLRRTGGRKGQLLQRPGFLGAAREVPLGNVLSEGEQTVLALAGFLTEAHFDESGSALVFDDPVSSLDHVRRDKVALRLVELARTRQVVVFTHDHTFAAALLRASRDASVPHTARSVERRGDDAPGLCQEGHPWDVKDVDARLVWLEQNLARIRRERAQWGQEQYASEVATWAGRLSMTWERALSLDVAGQIFNPGTLEVQVKKLRVLARLTATDDEDFQRGYSQCSAWAERHDKALALNYVAPQPDDLSRELAAIRVWRKRVKGYLNNG